MTFFLPIEARQSYHQLVINDESTARKAEILTMNIGDCLTNNDSTVNRIITNVRRQKQKR